MTLQDLVIRVTLDTSSSDLIKDFFVPLLTASVSYDRGVGFFSSGWVRKSADGMIEFARNGGHARWITSPIISPQDWQALSAGEEAKNDPLLYQILQRNLEQLERDLQDDTLSALAWMIADGILEFRFGLPRGRLDGDFHDKFGVFGDSNGNFVSFNGSYNDSIQGLRNYESIKVFVSWRPEYAELVESDKTRFERLWSNLDPNVRVFDMPEAARDHILRLRTTERPYPEPKWIKLRSSKEARQIYRPARPCIPPQIILRDYQLKAVDAWFEHHCLGCLEMATGSGKTITALAASARLFERERRLAAIIAVPYQHLVDQWDAEAKSFGYRSVLAYQSTSAWVDDLNQQIIEYNAGARDFISVITTHTTFISAEFQNTIGHLTGPALLIADEAHHLGAEQSRHSYPANVAFRLALSATPNRWFDEEGTLALRTYFGETVFVFSLKDAIGTCLTPYYYFPHLVDLTEDELHSYAELSERIARVFGRKDDESQERLKMLLIQRAELLNKAANKLPCLSDLVDQAKEMKHTLFYCAPGQIDEVSRMLGWEKGLLIAQFTNRESMPKRRELLGGFADGRWQALVAMHCLDEGVDVPSTKEAYILASSGNPREFIQRRGRILRQAEGKKHAVIHDLVTIPAPALLEEPDSAAFASERSILRHELQRFKEFAGLALNKHQALDVIWSIATHYGMQDF